MSTRCVCHRTLGGWLNNYRFSKCLAVVIKNLRDDIVGRKSDIWIDGRSRF